MRDTCAVNVSCIVLKHFVQIIALVSIAAAQHNSCTHTPQHGFDTNTHTAAVHTAAVAHTHCVCSDMKLATWSKASIATHSMIQ